MADTPHVVEEEGMYKDRQKLTLIELAESFSQASIFAGILLTTAFFALGCVT